MENTKIEWAMHTFNPWRGCTKVSPACDNCYAATMSKRNPGTLGIWGDEGTRVVAAESYWRKPLQWDKAAADSSVRDRPRVFCASLADVFEDWTGPMLGVAGEELYTDKIGGFISPAEPADYAANFRPTTIADVRARLFALIDATPNLDWLLLTKRPENIARMMPAQHLTRYGGVVGDRVRPNVWLGTTVENQEQVSRLNHLAEVPAVVKFVSAEPLLGPLVLHGRANGLTYNWLDDVGGRGISWIIAGGESGPGARPSHPDWFRSIRDQCTAAGVPFFFKQWGDFGPTQPADHHSHKHPQCYARWNEHTVSPHVGKKIAGRTLDGRTWSETPSVQEAVA